MRKEFEVGISLESDTVYYATKAEYHIYLKDTVTVEDERYVALRANSPTQDFAVFTLIQDKRNVTVDFGGATVVLHGKIQPFLIDRSENITIKNCNVTYDRPLYTEAMIAEVTPQYIRIRLNEHCPCRVVGDRLIPYSDTWESETLNCDGHFFQVFDPKTREGCGAHLGVVGTPVVMHYDRPFTIDRYTAEQDGEYVRLHGTFPSFYQVDRVLTIEHEPRDLSSVFTIDSKDVHVENYRILSGCGMGFYSYRTENIYLDGFRLTYDEKSPCLIANSADALHTFGTSGVFEIKNSVFEGMIDDGLNIHGNFRTVDRVCGNVIYTRNASCEKQAKSLYREGDVIAVYNGPTMEEAARYTVLKIEPVDDKISKFTVDRPALPHNDGDLIECITANCDVTVENCVFGKANTHLRLQSRGKFVMRHCETELPLLLSGDASFWFESGPVTDLTVENCRFTSERARIIVCGEVLPTEKAPYYHRNLKIVNNEFVTDLPMECGQTDGIVFTGNRNTAGKPMTLRLTNCGSVTAEGVTVERFSEEKSTLNVN